MSSAQCIRCITMYECTLYIVQYLLNGAQSLYTYIVQCTMYIVHCTMLSV